MNRDEREAESQNQTRSGAELAREVALGSLPAEILSAGDAPAKPAYVLDVQAAVDKAVSQATGSQRMWNRKTLHKACKAARPAVEQGMRQAGKAFTHDELRAAIRMRVKAYVDRYAVALPPDTVLGNTQLEAVAADICGALAMPWTAFMPPQVQLAMAASKAGKPQAVSWLKRFFAKKAAAPVPPAAPSEQAAPAPAATTPASAAPSAATGSSDSLGDEDLGAWMHKMNPLYWLKSAQERKFIDAEKQAWIDNAYNVKQQQKKEQVMAQAQKALQAKQASATAYQRTAELEAQLKSIESQISGAIGPAEIMGRAEIVGQDDTKLMKLEDPFAAKIPEEAAAPVLKKIQKARQLNEANRQDLEVICTKLRSGEGLTPDETSKLLIMLARNEQLHTFRKAVVSGDLYASNPARAQIQRLAVLGAVKSLTPAEQQQLAHLVKLAKTGNPRAAKALEVLRAQGYATMGSIISDTFKWATKPITVPAKYLWKGTKWTGKKLGIIKGGKASAEQIRLNRLKAAQKRRLAAQARARAADAESDAEYRAQQAVAAAADAEADAADAEATAKEAQMMTAEAEYLPGQTQEAAEPAADESGLPPAAPPSAAVLNAPYAFRGVKPIVTKLPDSPSPEVEKVKAVKKALVAKKNPRAAKILAKSEENSPGGMKLRASMKLYAGAKLNPKGPEAKAIRTMAAKAKRGDKQALADIHAVKLAQVAVKADQKAGRQTAALYAADARKKKVAAVQKKAEIAAADVLIRRSRTHQLAQLAKIERKAAAGDPKAKAFVKNVVVKAKQGDPKAKKVASGLVLAKHVRTVAPTRRERKNLCDAHKLVTKVAKGDRKAIAQARVIRAAAAHGNPNAIRAKRRLQTAAAVHQTIATGVIVMPAAIVTAERQGKKRKANQQKIQVAETKLAKGTASREELQAGAKAAADNGDKAKAGELLAASAAAPSKAETLKKTSAVLAAASNDNPKAQASMEKAKTLASQGDPLGMEAMGNVVAVKNLDQISKGKPMDPEMASAVKLTHAASEGDQAAAEQLKVTVEKAKAGDGAAIKATVVAAGAVAVAKSLANNPAARDEWLAKAGVKTDEAVEKMDTDLSPHPVGPHPLSSLGRDELPPIRGLWQLVTESLRALALATSDPVANYRQGVAARATSRRLLTASTATGDDDDDEPEPPKPGKKTKKKDPEAKYRVHAKVDPEAQYRVHGTNDVTGKDDYGFARAEAAHKKYIEPAFTTKKITKADVVAYLNNLHPDARELSAKVLVATFRDKGVAVLGKEERDHRLPSVVETLPPRLASNLDAIDKRGRRAFLNFYDYSIPVAQNENIRVLLNGYVIAERSSAPFTQRILGKIKPGTTRNQIMESFKEAGYNHTGGGSGEPAYPISLGREERQVVNDSKEAIEELAKQTKNPEMRKYILAIKDQPANSAERQGRMLYAVESVQAEKIAASTPALAGDAKDDLDAINKMMAPDLAKQIEARKVKPTGSSGEDRLAQLREKIAQLRKKTPQTDADKRELEQATEQLERAEAMSGVPANLESQIKDVMNILELKIEPNQDRLNRIMRREPAALAEMHAQDTKNMERFIAGDKNVLVPTSRLTAYRLTEKLKAGDPLPSTPEFNNAYNDYIQIKAGKKPPKERYEAYKARWLKGNDLMAATYIQAFHGYAELDDASKDRPAVWKAFTSTFAKTSAAGDDSGADVPEAHKKLVDATRERLGKLKDKAGKGDKEAITKWTVVKKNYATAKAKAAKGDIKAKELLAILDATKLF